MRHTTYRPPGSWLNFIAPTDYQGNRLRWGEVSDPTAHRMGGVAGNAGVFSTADDLALLVQMLLNGGVGSNGTRILSAQAVAAMTKPYCVSGSCVRGLGWDMESPYSRGFNAAFCKGSFGHTGYTGTSIWVDPCSKTFLIILTSRLHPNGHGSCTQLRARVASTVASVARMGPPARVEDWDPLEVINAGLWRQRHPRPGAAGRRGAGRLQFRRPQGQERSGSSPTVPASMPTGGPPCAILRRPRASPSRPFSARSTASPANSMKMSPPAWIPTAACRCTASTAR